MSQIEQASPTDGRQDIDPETGWHRRVVERLAKSIEYAHGQNPSCWAVHTAEGKPFIAFGKTNVAHLSDNSYQLIVDTLRLSDEDKEVVERLDAGRTYDSASRQHLRLLRFGNDEVERVLPRFEAAHESAIRGLTNHRSARSPWHQQQFIGEMERILGKTLPAPAFLDDPTIRLDSENNAGAVSDANWDPAMLREIARSILLAHETKPASWAVTYKRNEILLYISMVKVMAVSPTLGHFLVSGLPATHSQSGLGEEHISSARAFEHPVSWIHSLEPDRFITALESYRPSHESIVKTLAESVKNKAHRAGQHEQKTVEFIAGATNMELPEPAYTHGRDDILTSSAPTTSLIPNEARADSVANILLSIENQFASIGLKYTPDQIATFYTALQTKGFVVLSGISGTGKSKIAQHFVEMLPFPEQGTLTKAVDLDSVISLNIKPYMRKYRRAIIPVKQLDLLPAMEPGMSIDIELTLSADKHSGRLECRRHSTSNMIRVLHFHGDIGNAIEQMPLDQPLYLSPVYGDDEETLARIDMFASIDQMPEDVIGDGTFRKIQNNLFLPVRPDWRDSTSLLGYYNPLTSTYEWTDFLRFILQAAESYEAKDGLAWFVILDEMNLAHVEYYFADLLSIIESGRREDGFSHDPIRLTYPESLADDAPPREIYLPPNLYIIGTVNMDETTHAFSPKVLDRAFTIELTDVRFDDYPPAGTTSTSRLSGSDKMRLLAAFTRDGTYAQVRKDEIAAAVSAHPHLRIWLSTLNTRLARDRFHFGYRVFDEIAQFVFNADRNGMFGNWEIAFDHAVYMKVLPKFNGSRARLRGPLTTLVAWAINPDNPDPDIVTGVFRSAGSTAAPNYDSIISEARFERVAGRALQMMIALEDDGFVSFG